MNQFRMNEDLQTKPLLALPQFMLETGPSLFSEAHETLELEHLEGGFSLRDKDAHVDFHTVNAEMARVDVDDRQRQHRKGVASVRRRQRLFPRVVQHPALGKAAFCV